jgi:hypothetical protein
MTSQVSTARQMGTKLESRKGIYLQKSRSVEHLLKLFSVLQRTLICKKLNYYISLVLPLIRLVCK